VGADGYIDPGNHANYWNGNVTIGSPYWRTIVGEFERSGSAYGTFDQGGNVWEWNEAIITGAYRGLRGGSFSFDYDGFLQASYRNMYSDPTRENATIGFRVSQVPEPSSIITLLGGSVGLFGIRRRSSYGERVPRRSRAMANK